MIDNYEQKKKDKNIELAFAESGQIAIIERKFDEGTGLPVMKPTQEVSSKQIEDLIADNDRQMAPLVERGENLKLILADVKEKETEREKAVKKADKK